MGVPNLAGHATTWAVTESKTGATSEATMALVAGESHYVTGFSASAVSTGGGSGVQDTLIATLKDGSTDKIIISFDANFQGDDHPGGGPVVVDLSNPLKITQGAATSLEITGAATGTEAIASIWGFTLDD